MISDDFLFPYLVSFFARYLEDLEITSGEAHSRGPSEFVKWMKKSLPSPEAAEEESFPLLEGVEYEDEDDEEEDSPAEAIHILTHLCGEKDYGWLDPYWSRLITSFRRPPKYPIDGIYGAFVIKWADKYILPFVCAVPEQLVQPRGSINDHLLSHISEVFAVQFSELLTGRSADELHELQSGSLPKEAIEKVLMLARDAVLKSPKKDRAVLRRALRFLMAIGLPPLPPDALRKASQSLGPKKVSKSDWRIFPIEGDEEGK